MQQQQQRECETHPFRTMNLDKFKRLLTQSRIGVKNDRIGKKDSHKVLDQLVSPFRRSLKYYS